MSAFAAMAVASPVAVVAVSGLAAEPAPQEREFVQAAMITDLPGELMSVLSQGLSQFGINLPPMPMLGGAGPATSTMLSPGLGVPGLGAPGLTTPGLTPGLTTPGLTAPGALPSLTDPGLTNPALTNPGLTSPTGEVPGGLTTPGLTPPGGLTTPGLADPGLAAPGLTDPALGASGLTTPQIGLDPALATPISNSGLGLPGEIPISAPIGADPMLGTYPIMDPYLGGTAMAPMAPAGGGGLIGDLTSAANQLGAGQAIDLLKGVVMPAITSAVQSAAPPAVPPAPAPPAAPGL